MFQQNLITNLLGIANVFVDKIENNSSNIEIHLSTQSKAQVCPCCGQTTKYIHDYRTQKIRDIPFQGKETFLLLRKRRYICKACGKRFFERYDFLPRYRHFTGRVYASVINALREKISFKDVGKRFGISSTSVFRALAWLFPNARVVVDRYHWVR